jgi:hypothetical protein
MIVIRQNLISSVVIVEALDSDAIALTLNLIGKAIAPLLTGLIVSLITIFGLPIDPASATIIVLYIVKIGLNTFCEYTEPATDPKL